MNRARWFGVLSMILIAAIIPTIPSYACSSGFIPTMDEMSEMADVIFIGKMTGINGKLLPEYRIFNFTVSEYLKNPLLTPRVSTKSFWGPLGNVTVTSTPDPSFEKGEEYLVFVVGNHTPYTVLYQTYGKIPLGAVEEEMLDEIREKYHGRKFNYPDINTLPPIADGAVLAKEAIEAAAAADILINPIGSAPPYPEYIRLRKI